MKFLCKCFQKLEHKQDRHTQADATEPITKCMLKMLTRSSATAEIVRDMQMAIQGHSGSSVVVPIDMAYMTSY